MTSKISSKISSKLLKNEQNNRQYFATHPDEFRYLYPNLDDPNFNIKIAHKKEFSETQYDGTIYDIKQHAEIASNADYELLPHQAFARNFMSFATPYNSLLLFHGLGSGKTCSAIGVCEEMRIYLKEMGINKKIIIVASPNVQDNFKLQLFDERFLKEVNGIWTTKGCLGNNLLREVNPTGMTGIKKEHIVVQVRQLISRSYHFTGYLQFSNEIERVAGKTENPISTKIRNLQNVYNNSLIVIDEVHNIRISDDNDSKNVAKNLMFLVNAAKNVRLLLLSATPMFNSYKEIVWLLNLMNLNDRRGVVNISDIFDASGNFKPDFGRELLIQKATGYISYVRGENPYTFPFRVYPNKFAPEHTFKNVNEYPKYQINGAIIPNSAKIEKLSLYLTTIGEYQNIGYKYITHFQRKKLQERGSGNDKTFNYIDLQIPIQALNIIYPHPELEALASGIDDLELDIDYSAAEEETEISDISPVSIKDDTSTSDNSVKEINEILSTGPIETEAAATEQLPEKKTSLASLLQPSPKLSRKVESAESSSSFEFPPPKTAPKIAPKTAPKSLPKVESAESSPEVESSISLELLPLPKLTTKKAPKSLPKVESAESSSSFELPPSKSSPKIVKEKFQKPIAKFPPDINQATRGLERVTKRRVIEESSTSSSHPSTTGGHLPHNPSTTGGENSNSTSSPSPPPLKQINVRELTGVEGLKRVMNFIDTKTPAVKGEFEYKQGVESIFAQNNIGKYSSKIANICKSIYNSDGIILIYSSYIDAGIIPIALALEEMGFRNYGTKNLFKTPPTPIVDVRTMKEPTNRKDFKPATYLMITGDPRLSPNTDAAIKTITNTNNINGEIIKVVLISQAGSEGLDFKAIRQIHIIEPWYNLNRIEQIIGRGVRNNSHKDLPFEKRNVMIFLYGTILEEAAEEAADLYVYRISELKAVKIGQVSRLLKQISVDCHINISQTQFTTENFQQIPENLEISQELSNHEILENFEVGDNPFSATCDYMAQCEYKCLPDIQLKDSTLDNITYNENFMSINSEKLIQKIKNLMRMRFFYQKNELIQLINTPREYSLSQIYYALTQLVNDKTEYLVDKYGRIGHFINIGKYYLFQPSELNNEHISIFDRSVPVDFKHNKIILEMPSEKIINAVVDKRGVKERKDAAGLETKEEEIRPQMRLDITQGKKVFNEMYANYVLARTPPVVSSSKAPKKTSKNWYELYASLFNEMIQEMNFNAEMLDNFLVEHICDMLWWNSTIELLNYLYSDAIERDLALVENDKRLFAEKVRNYFESQIVVNKRGLTAILLYDGISRILNQKIFVLKANKWDAAQPEDIRDLQATIQQKYKLTKPLNRYVGFIGFFYNYKVFKVKDVSNLRSTGFRCDQSQKEKILSIMFEMTNDEKFVNSKMKKVREQLCVIQELIFRKLQRQEKDGKIWFLNTSQAIYNEFEKRE